jgi:hypothetical protein
MPNPVQAKKKV